MSNQLILTAGNNITLSQSTNATGATVSIAGGNGVAMYDGAASISSGTAYFSDANNVSFGINGQTITGSASFSQTNQILSMFATGNTTDNTTGTFDARSITLNAYGAASVGFSGGSMQMSVPAISGLAATGAVSISTNGNTVSIGAPAFSVGVASNSTVSNQLILTGGNNITLSQSTNATGATVTISGGNGVALSGAGGAVTSGTASFVNANGVSFSVNGQSISGSVAAQSVQTLSVSLTGGSLFNSSTMTRDARSLSFSAMGAMNLGISNGIIQMSVPSNYLTTARASNDAIGLNTAGTHVTWTVNSSGLSLNAAGYAGTSFSGTNVSGTVNSNGVSLSVGAGGGYNSAEFGGSTANSTMPLVWLGSTNGSGNLSFGLTGSTVTGSYSQTNQTVGLYALGNTTQNSSTTLDARNPQLQRLGRCHDGLLERLDSGFGTSCFQPVGHRRRKHIEQCRDHQHRRAGTDQPDDGTVPYR